MLLVRDVISRISLMNSQRVRLYESPFGRMVLDLAPGENTARRRNDTVGPLLDAEVIGIEGNSSSINLYVRTEHISKKAGRKRI